MSSPAPQGEGICPALPPSTGALPSQRGARKTPSHSLCPGYKSGLRTPVQRRFSLQLAHCSNSVSHSNKLYFPLILFQVWKFSSKPRPDHDRTQTAGSSGAGGGAGDSCPQFPSCRATHCPRPQAHGERLLCAGIQGPGCRDDLTRLMSCASHGDRQASRTRTAILILQPGCPGADGEPALSPMTRAPLPPSRG